MRLLPAGGQALPRPADRDVAGDGPDGQRRAAAAQGRHQAEGGGRALLLQRPRLQGLQLHPRRSVGDAHVQRRHALRQICRWHRNAQGMDHTQCFCR